MAGTFAWASYTAIDMAIEREELDSVNIHTAESQAEIRTLWTPNERFRYRFKITGRKNAAAGDEVASLRAFYRAQHGRWDTFTMTDPVDGATVSVRFNTTLRMTRQMPQWWEMQFETITVVNAT